MIRYREKTKAKAANATPSPLETASVGAQTPETKPESTKLAPPPSQTEDVTDKDQKK